MYVLFTHLLSLEKLEVSVSRIVMAMASLSAMLELVIKNVSQYFLISSTLLKGAVSRDFLSFLFHESKPSGALINSLKGFCLKICFRKDIREISDSAQC